MKKQFRSLCVLALSMWLLISPCLALNVQDALKLLDTLYVDELPQAAYQAQSLDELLAPLNDPYTVYLSAEEYQAFLSSINDNHVVGIGVTIQPHENGILIQSVLNNSPAQQAGLAAGDIITAVDGVFICTTEDATARITGEAGTSVRLSVLKTDGSTQELELVRRLVTIPTTVQYAPSEDGNAGVILCNSFGDGTVSHFMEALLVYDNSVNAWIIDLTGNPGGTDVAAAGTAGWFIGGAPMVYYRDGQGNYSYVYTFSSTPVLTSKPAIILTAPYSASGAELFSAAMRDYGAGISVGQRTFGKGVAQTMLTNTSHPDLFSDDAFKVTTYRFFSPKGTTNDQLGLLPTLQISFENTYLAALLLCADEPEQPTKHLKVHLSGLDFHINLDTALSREYRAAFVELLEALLPSTQLWQAIDGQWTPTTPEAVANKYKLTEYAPRTFSDLDSCPQADAVTTLATYGLVGGDGNGSFRPHDTLTRAELSAMLANLLNLKPAPVNKSRFYDVSPDDWYAPAVHAVWQRGFLPAYTDGSFHPNANVSQQELVEILSDLSVWLNMYAYDQAQITPTEDELAPYSAFSPWARKAAWLLDTCQLDLDLSGIDPKANATRAIAADLFCRLLRQTGILWQ